MNLCIDIYKVKHDKKNATSFFKLQFLVHLSLGSYEINIIESYIKDLVR
jgi:hypothetical protein